MNKLLMAGLLAAAALEPANANAQNLKADIDSVVARFAQLNAAPGMGVVVVRDTQVLYQKGIGFADVEKKIPVDATTRFYIASTTKSFTGLTAAILAQRGVWNLDAPLSKYLPQLKLKAPLNADSITIRSLMSHTSGIAGGAVDTRLAFIGEYKGNAELIELLGTHDARPNGRSFQYGNIGYNVAALAMDAVTRKSWKDVEQAELFTPLNMTSATAYISKVPAGKLAQPYGVTPTGYRLIPQGKTDRTMQSAGGLVMAMPDMATWLELHLNDGKLNGKQILPAAAVRETHKLQATTPPQRGRPWRQFGYGFGWQIAENNSDTLFVHGGGFPGYATHMSFMPSQHVGVAVFTNNGEIGGGVVDFLATAIYDVVRGKPVISQDSINKIATQIQKGRDSYAASLAKRAQRPQQLQFPLSAYVGRYYNPTIGTLRLEEVNGKLEAHFGDAFSAVETFDAAKNQLRVEPFGDGEVITVTMTDGKATTLQMGPLTFTRVN